ncbi:MAG: leucine-rich repeat domain-containing protein, partial [Gammaproteobacteria bacterium]|nr:leucine-rich repeat domain-containing protein [Gammaproteobacteria bacterium]
NRNDNGIDDLVVENIKVTGFIFSTDDNGVAIEFQVASEDSVYFDTDTPKATPDTVESSDLSSIYARRINTTSMHRKLTLGNVEGGTIYDLIGIVNPPIKSYGPDDNHYLEVYSEDDLENPVCTDEQFVKLQHSPELTLTTSGLEDKNIKYVRCLLNDGTLQVGKNYLLKLYSDNSSVEDKTDDVLIAEFTHHIDSIPTPAAALNVQEVTVNDANIVNNQVNGFIGKNETLNFKLPVAEGVDNYYVRIRNLDDVGSWILADNEIRKSSTSNQISVLADGLGMLNQLRIMTTQGGEPLAVAVSAGAALIPGVAGDFNAFFTANGVAQNIVLNVTSDTSGIISCSVPSGSFSCIGGGSVDWDNRSVSLTLSDDADLIPDLTLIPITLKFYTADSATVSAPVLGAIGSIFAASRDYGSTDFQAFTLTEANGLVDVEWGLLEGVDHYTVHWSENIEDLYGAGGFIVGPTTDYFIQVSGLTAGARYYFKVVASMTDGSEIETAIRSVKLDDAAPVFSAPQNINLVATENSIQVLWDKVTDAIGYEVRYSSNEAALDAGTASYVSALDTSNSVTLTGLSSNTTYYIRVAAVSPVEEFFWSPTMTKTTQTSTVPTVNNVILTPSYFSIDVSWDDVGSTDLISYEVEYATSESDLGTDAALTEIPEGNFVQLYGLNLDTIYFVRVKAVLPDTTLMSAVTSTTTLTAGTPLSTLNIADAGLQACIESYTSGLTFIEEVTYLYCSDQGITNISGIENFINLESLDLSSNPINAFDATSAPALLNLSKLLYLNIAHTNTTDLSSLALLSLVFPTLDLTFPSLETLDVSGNLLTSVPDVPYFPNLNYLNVSDNNLTAIPVLNSVSNLATLNLSLNNITTIPATLPYSHLYSLVLEDNAITSVPDLSGLPMLQDLYLSNNQIQSIADQTGLPNLASLYLTGNPLQTVSRFDNLANLDNFYLTLSSQETALACDILAAWDMRFDFRDGSKLGNIQWVECAAPTSYTAELTEDFSSGTFTSDQWTFSRDGVDSPNFVWNASDLAAYSPSLNIAGTAAMKLAVNSPVDTVIQFTEDTFISSGVAYLGFYIDGVEQAQWGDFDETATVHTFDVPAGTHTLEWRFVQNTQTALDYTESAMVDDIHLLTPIRTDFMVDSLIDNFDAGISDIWSTNINSATATAWLIGLGEGPEVEPSDAAKAPVIDNLEYAGLVLDSGAITQDGYIVFDMKIESEQNYDFLTLYVNDVPAMKISGQEGWITRTLPVAAGDKLEWRYEKDDSSIFGQDTFWLDNVYLITESQL